MSVPRQLPCSTALVECAGPGSGACCALSVFIFPGSQVYLFALLLYLLLVLTEIKLSPLLIKTTSRGETAAACVVWTPFKQTPQIPAKQVHKIKQTMSIRDGEMVHASQSNLTFVYINNCLRGLSTLVLFYFELLWTSVSCLEGVIIPYMFIHYFQPNDQSC